MVFIMRRLDIWHEFIGFFVDVDTKSDPVVAVFQDYNYELPDLKGPQLNSLKKLKGKDIGILRTDVPGKEYLFREL